jgi:hypothetical protein
LCFALQQFSWGRCRFKLPRKNLTLFLCLVATVIKILLVIFSCRISGKTADTMFTSRGKHSANIPHIPSSHSTRGSALPPTPLGDNGYIASLRMTTATTSETREKSCFRNIWYLDPDSSEIRISDLNLQRFRYDLRRIKSRIYGRNTQTHPK